MIPTSIRVSGHNVEIGENLRDFAKDQIEKLGQKYFGRIIHSDVTYSKGIPGKKFCCSARIRVGTDLYITGKGEDTNAYTATNIAIEHADKQLRRIKRHSREDKPTNVLKDNLFRNLTTRAVDAEYSKIYDPNDVPDIPALYGHMVKLAAD